MFEWLSSMVLYGSSLMQQGNAARQREQNADRHVHERVIEKRRKAERHHAIERSERNAQIQRDAQLQAGYALAVAPEQFLRNATLRGRKITITVQGPSALAPTLERLCTAAFEGNYVAQLWRAQFPLNDVTATSVFERLPSATFVAAHVVSNGSHVELRACAWGRTERDPRVRRLGAAIPVDRILLYCASRRHNATTNAAENEPLQITAEDRRVAHEVAAAIVTMRLAVLADRVSRPSPLRSLDLIPRLAPIVPATEVSAAVQELLAMLLAPSTVDVAAGASLALVADKHINREYARSIFSATANRFIGRTANATLSWAELVADLGHVAQREPEAVAALAVAGVRLHISECEALLAHALREG